MKLYWVTTDDHHEDWFIIASSKKEACKLHEDYEGYDSGDAYSQKILTIPADISAEIGWPSEELLEAVGAKFINKGDTRVVEINGQQYVEGMLEALIRELDDNIFESLGEERLNQTKRTNPIKH